MKTLSEIINQTGEEKLRILSSFVKENGREDFGAGNSSLNWLFDKACEKADYAEPYAVENGFKLYEVEVEYFGSFDGKNGRPAYITVYIADNFDAETEEYCEYFAL